MRIAVLSDTPIAADLPSGFARRYHLALELLADAGHDLLVLPGSREAAASSDPRVVSLTSDAARHLRAGHLGGAEPSARWAPARRVRHAARTAGLRLGRPRWEAAAAAEVERWGPDALLAFAPRQPELARLAPRGVPVALFVEEDLGPLRALKEGTAGGGRRRGRRAQLLRPQLLRPQPRVVVTVAPSEEPWARRRHPGSRVVTVPNAIDVEYWSAPVDPDREVPEVFCVGNFSHPRNHLGLGQVARELVARAGDPPRLGVASAWEPPADLLEELPFVRYLGAPDDVRPLYRGTRVALVPSFSVTGAKNQILQAWATRVPVVTSEAAAASVGGDHGVDLLAGSAPAAVASLLLDALSGAAAPGDRVERGYRRVRDEFSRPRMGAALDRVLELLGP